MFNVLKIQLKILSKQNLARWSFGICLFFTILLGFLIFHFSSFSGSFEFLSLMKGEKNGFNFSISLTYSVYKILLFFMIIISSTCVSNEAQTGILKSLLVKRLERDHLILGKSFSLLVFFFMMFSLVFLLSISAGGILYGFGDIAEKNYIIHSASSLFVNIWLAFFLMVLPIFSLINFSLFFSVIFNNNIFPIVLGFGLHFIFSIFIEMDLFKNIFLTNYLFFPLSRFQKMAQGFPLSGSAEILNMILATAAYSTIFLICSILIFRKKELP